MLILSFCSLDLEALKQAVINTTENVVLFVLYLFTVITFFFRTGSVFQSSFFLLQQVECIGVN